MGADLTEKRTDSDQPADADRATPSATFVRAVRHALRHLYDPDELRHSELLQLLPVDAHNRASSLQQMLTAAIEALKPKSGMSLQSSAWATYLTLSARYLQQFQQAQVAHDLGLSPRQMRRRDSQAIRWLAGYLWTRYDLAGRADAMAHPLAPPKTEAEAASRAAELQWLEHSAENEPAAAAEVLQALLKTIGPMAQAYRTRIECTLPPDLPPLLVQVGAVRQALLSVLTAGIRGAPEGQVVITAEAAPGRVCISVRAISVQPAPEPQAEAQRENIEMARELAKLSRGMLEVSEGERSALAVRLTLPAVEQATVLVIDDNADTLQLFERYLAGSRYAFCGAKCPAQALALAEKLAPQAIVLDVMLPGTDGWDLLGRLREHPQTRSVPVIICTILPQETLALTLGAAAFLRKPASRAELLATLDELVGTHGNS